MNVYKFDFQKLTNDELNTKENLEYLNHILFEVVVQEGALVCNNCGREYMIKDGIPNLVLNDDEI